MNDWVPVENFPDYEVSYAGEVRLARSRRLLKPSRTTRGNAKITLRKDNVSCTRSLPLIVAKVHLYNVYNPEIFNTPIHLDFNLMNCHVDNLMWRPLWFAREYHNQIDLSTYTHNTISLIDLETNKTYIGFREICETNGFVWRHVYRSCTRAEYVFPTTKLYRFTEYGNMTDPYRTL